MGSMTTQRNSQTPAAKPKPSAAPAAGKTQSGVYVEINAAQLNAAGDNQITVSPAPNAEGLVIGRDGRNFRWPESAEVRAAIIQQANNSNPALFIDYGHESYSWESDTRAAAKAAAWPSNWQINADLSVTHTPNWTATGKTLVDNKELRYISPVYFTAKDSNVIIGLGNPGLTNIPNLADTHLNSQQTPQETNMSNVLLTAAAALALAIDTDGVELNAAGHFEFDEATVIDAIATTKATAQANSQGTDGNNVAVLTRENQNLTAQLNSLNAKMATRHSADLSAELNAAVAAGKIPPSDVDFYTNHLGKPEQFDDLKARLAALPASNASAAGAPAGEPTGDESQVELNAADLAAAERYGLTAEEAAAALAAAEND